GQPSTAISTQASSSSFGTISPMAGLAKNERGPYSVTKNVPAISGTIATQKRPRGLFIKISEENENDSLPSGKAKSSKPYLSGLVVRDLLCHADVCRREAARHPRSTVGADDR